MDIVTAIAQGNAIEARAQIHEALSAVMTQKLDVLRKVIGESVFGPCLTEANVMKQGRTLLIRRRIRKGKVQRNIRKSAVKGFTLRRGKITRIPVAKRIKMKITQRRAARKRKAHLQVSLRKRKLSLRKRKALGLR
jgi:hypothetical protein